jgi:ribosomal-protein-alanine N-acetyltransferase
LTAADLALLHARCFITPRPWNADEISGLLASPLTFLLTRPQAFLIGRAAAGEAEVLTLAVAPEARRQGLGRALVQRFLAEAGRRGAADAFLEVAADNPAAEALYLACGFTLRGRRRAYYHGPAGQQIDALVLGRAIPAPERPAGPPEV